MLAQPNFGPEQGLWTGRSMGRSGRTGRTAVQGRLGPVWASSVGVLGPGGPIGGGLVRARDRVPSEEVVVGGGRMRIGGWCSERHAT